MWWCHRRDTCSYVVHIYIDFAMRTEIMRECGHTYQFFSVAAHVVWWVRNARSNVMTTKYVFFGSNRVLFFFSCIASHSCHHTQHTNIERGAKERKAEKHLLKGLFKFERRVNKQPPPLIWYWITITKRGLLFSILLQLDTALCVCSDISYNDLKTPHRPHCAVLSWDEMKDSTLRV